MKTNAVKLKYCKALPMRPQEI